MKKAVAILIVTFLSCSGFSQNVAINADGAAPNPNAMLDIVSSSSGNGGGLLIPRLTNALRTTKNIALAGGLLDDSGDLRGGAAQGLMVFQTDGAPGIYVNISSTATPQWIYLGGGAVSFGSVTVDSTGYYMIGTDKVLHTGGLTGTLIVGNGGSQIAHSSKYEGYYNTLTGLGAGYNITTGYSNTVTGCEAERFITTGANNTACGYKALNFNTTGISNSAFGYQALSLVNPTDKSNTGNLNTAVGTLSGKTVTSGSSNTFLGAQADASSGIFINATAIGYGAIVNASNKVVIGNSAVTVIGGYVNWSNYSDAREKENVRDYAAGLGFIEKLRPVSYNYIGQDKMKNGFIAQEVEQACEETGIEFGGLVKPETPEGRYMLSYSEFVVPLVNAVKELKALNESQQSQIESLKIEMEKLRNSNIQK